MMKSCGTHLANKRIQEHARPRQGKSAVIRLAETGVRAGRRMFGGTYLPSYEGKSANA